MMIKIILKKLKKIEDRHRAFKYNVLFRFELRLDCILLSNRTWNNQLSLILWHKKDPRELIALESVVNVRCYELTALYFCALLASRGCGNRKLKPCQSLCKGIQMFKLTFTSKIYFLQGFII